MEEVVIKLRGEGQHSICHTELAFRLIIKAGKGAGHTSLRKSTFTPCHQERLKAGR